MKGTKLTGGKCIRENRIEEYTAERIKEYFLLKLLKITARYRNSSIIGAIKTIEIIRSTVKIVISEH